MKRIVLVLAMAAIAALMLAASAFPAAAAAPDAGCPTGFVPKVIKEDLPSTVGDPSTEINTSEEDCFKKLENFPQPLKERFGTDEVGIDDVVRFGTTSS